MRARVSQIKQRTRLGVRRVPTRGRGHAPEIQDLAGDDAGLGGLPLRQVVEEELAVTHDRVRPLPPLLHPGRLWDLRIHSDRVSLGHTGQLRLSGQ